MKFKHTEDQKFFADLLTDGNIEVLNENYSELFDFRHPAIKRWEFNKIAKKVLTELIDIHKGECQLNIHPECDIQSGFEPDHIIPLSSNVLNKTLRGVKGKDGTKAKAQSFGSNHIRNLTLACKKCNSLKKHRILSGELLKKLIH